MENKKHKSVNNKRNVIGILVIIIILLQSFTLNNDPSENPTGTIEGIVVDKKTGETVIGAQVTLEGNAKMGAVTSFDGKFSLINLKPGSYNLKIVNMSYKTVILENISVEAHKSTQLKIELDEKTVELNEVTVSVVRRTNTEMSMISSIKASAVITAGISGQQISRSLDRDASEVVKRIPGITIYDDKFIIIRGLNQRYNNVWINGSSVPSFESDSRAFSFDVIPSSVIDNLTVFKSPSPDLPADFTGGFVKITTKNMPDKNFFDIQYSTAFNEGTTFGSFYHQKRSSTDWLGFDNGMRALPSDFPSRITPEISFAEREKLGRQINPSWDPIKSQAIPDQRFNVTFGKRIQFKSTSLGNLTAIGYSNSFDRNDFIKRDYMTYDTYTSQSPLNYDFKETYYSNSVKLNLLHNWAYYFKNGKIEFRNLVNQIGKARTAFREGDEYYNTRYIKELENQYESRLITSSQLGGEWVTPNEKHKFDWVLGYALSKRDEPSLSRVRSTFVPDTIAPYDYVNAIGVQVSPQYGGLIFSNLTENTFSAGINYQLAFSGNPLKPIFRTGFFTERKKRVFNLRNLGFRRSLNFDESLQYIRPYNVFFSTENINSTNGIEIDEVTNPSDSYDGRNKLIAGYISAQFTYGRFNAFIGARIEYNNQQITSFDEINLPLKINIKKTDVFPSINTYYKISEKSLIRFAYGKSVNRPEFREIAPFNFYVFEKFASVKGNSTLKNAYIDNYDLRYEMYPNNGETFSVAVFYKKFKDPIEIKYARAGSGKAYTFDNALEANNYGVEIDLRKSLAFIFGNENYFLVANGSYIKSVVKFKNELHEITDRDRPLQGQSSYIANAGLFYQNDPKGLTINLLYNIMGKRIATVGMVMQEEQSDIPDVYEMPRNVVDLSFSKKINKLIEIKGGIKDILNQEAYQIQTVYNNNHDKIVDNLTSSYYPGRSYNLGVVFHIQ